MSAWASASQARSRWFTSFSSSSLSAMEAVARYLLDPADSRVSNRGVGHDLKNDSLGPGMDPREGAGVDQVDGSLLLLHFERADPTERREKSGVDRPRLRRLEDRRQPALGHQCTSRPLSTRPAPRGSRI